MNFRLSASLAAAAFAIGLAACNVEKTREGEAPDVDIDPGRLPAYDVDAPDIDIIKDTQKVVVPKVRVTRPRRDTVPR
jgi:NAD(P)H-dependent FMN reductase